MTPLTTLLGIRHPLLLAPMAGVSGGRLAAAVSRSGGLGFVGGGYGDRPWLGDAALGHRGPTHRRGLHHLVPAPPA
ncbi:MAG: nitronate monooxygenase [Burkholderiaceae bacterium]